MATKRIKKPNEFFSAHTSRIGKKIGFAIMTLGSSLTAALGSLEVKPIWIVVCALTTALGTIISHSFTEDE